MARARTIKPAFFLNTELGEMPPLARLLFVGLWCLADRDGLLKDEPKKIKFQVLPYDDCDMNELLNNLKVGKFIRRYEAEGIACIEILNFAKHQNIHPKEAKSELKSHLIKCKEISFPEIKVIKGRKRRKREEEGKEGKEGTPQTSPASSRGIKRLAPEIPELPATLNTEKFRAALGLWLKHKAERSESYKPTGLQALISKLEAMGSERASLAIANSIASNYAGIFEPKSTQQTTNGQTFKSAQERKDEREAAAFEEYKRRLESKNGTGRTSETSKVTLRPMAKRRPDARAPRNSGVGSAGDIVRGIAGGAVGAALKAANISPGTGRPPGISECETACDANGAGGTSRDAIGAKAAESLGPGSSDDQSGNLETQE